MSEWIDLHCHILPGVDDGARDIDSALAMARALSAAGFGTIAASPHYGEGPGGDVPIDLSVERRAQLQDHLGKSQLDLALLPNAEHHLTAPLLERVAEKKIVTIGGASQWLLLELPWRAVSAVEQAIFRVQSKGYRVLLAHPERYTYLSFDALEALSDRSIAFQLELGSFVGMYGARAQEQAEKLVAAGRAHVLATDLHRAQDLEAGGGVHAAMSHIKHTYGSDFLMQGLRTNPRAILDNAPLESLDALSGKSR